MFVEFLSALKEGNQFLNTYPAGKLKELYPPGTSTLTEIFFKHLSPQLQRMRVLFSYTGWEQLLKHRQTYLQDREIDLRQSLSDAILIAEGHVIVAAQGPLQDLVIMEALLPTLLSGHHVFLFVWDEPQRQAWDHWKSLLPEPRTVHILTWQEDLWNFAIRHPAVSRIVLHVPGPIQETRLLLSPEAWSKNPILFQRWKSMSLVTKGFVAERDLPLIFSSIHEGAGLGFWNTTRLFVESSVEKEFLKSWQELYPKWLSAFSTSQAQWRNSIEGYTNRHDVIFAGDSLLSSHGVGDFTRAKAQDFIKTQGRRIADNHPLLINTSACDEHHQLPTAEPLVTFHDLRYAFDINKWVTAAESYIWSLNVYGMATESLPSYLAQTPAPCIFKSHQPWAWAKLSWWHPLDLNFGYKKWIG